MNIYQKYSNDNVIPELLFAGVLIGVLFRSIVGAATIEILSESGKITPPGCDYIFFLLSIFSLYIFLVSPFLKYRKKELNNISITF